MTMEDSSSCMLTADAADRFLDRVSALVRAARLNTYFPPAERLLRNLCALHSRTHGGLYPQLSLEGRAGLPSLKEWARVQNDLEMAESAMSGLPPLASLRERLGTDPEGKERLRKLEYCSRLLALAPPPLESMDVELRHLEEDCGIVHVRVIVDSVLPDGLLLRWTVELAESLKLVESQELLIRNGEGFYPTPELAAQLSMLSTAPLGSEQAFLNLSALPGVTVQRVAKATLGPFCLGELPPAAPFGPLLAIAGGAFATFSFEVAGRDVVRDGSNDPLPHMLLESLAPDVLAECERSRIRLGYRVYRDRKFTTDATTQPVLESLCHAAGTRNIIYTAALAGSAAAEVTA